MTLEYNNIDKIAQRLSMLQTNVEAINDAYYSLYLADVEDDIELKQYGSNGTVSDYSPIVSDIQILTEDLFIRQVANFQKTINSLVKHGTYSPNGILTSEFASQLYINTRNKDMWVSLNANSNDSWQLIFSEEILGAHNRSAKAHEGYDKEVITVTDNYTGSATNAGTFNSESDLHNYSGELATDDYAFVLNTTDNSLNAYKYVYSNIDYWSRIGTYEGSFSSLADLESSISTPDEGDFADVKDGDNRYVYVYRTNAWVNEYNVNNSIQLTSALARLHGDKTRPFYVKNVAENSIYIAYTPEYATTATTMVYTGHKDQLFTKNKQDIVSAINEINQRIEDGREALKNLTKEEDYSIVNGNYNSEGEADLMSSGVKINYYKRNVKEVGTFEIETSVVDNFSSESYLTFSNFTPSANPWEIVFKFKTGTNVNTSQDIYSCSYNNDLTQYCGTSLTLVNGKIYAKGSTLGSSYDINIDSTWTININTNYWSRVKFTGSRYEFYLSTNGYEYTLQGIYENSSPIIDPIVSRIGNGNELNTPFLGSVDLADCYYSIGGMTSWTGTSLIFTSSPEGVEYLPPTPSIYGNDNYSFYDFTGGCSESNARLALRSTFEQNYISSNSSAGFIVKYPRKFVLKNVKYYASVPSDALNASIFTTYRVEGYNYETYNFQTIIETSGNLENVWNEAISTTNVISTDLYRITFLGQQATNGYASNIYLSGLRDLTQGNDESGDLPDPPTIDDTDPNNYTIAWEQPVMTSKTQYGEIVTNYGDGVLNWFDNNDSTEFKAGGGNNVRWYFPEKLKITQVQLIGRYAYSSAQETNIQVYTNVNGQDILLASGTGAAKTAPYYSTAIINDVIVDNLMFIGNNWGGNVPPMIKSINITAYKLDEPEPPEPSPSYDFDYYSEEEITTIIQSKEYVGVGTYYINVDANSYVDIELVGGGGCCAYTDGGRDNYGDTNYACHYYHCGGSGGYFKGTAFFSERGILMVNVPEGKKYTRSIYDIYSYPWELDDDGGDAVATFISVSGSVTEVARARGGKRGYPEFHLGYSAQVAGGTVSYNSSYVVNVEKAITGPNGYIYYSVFR